MNKPEWCVIGTIFEWNAPNITGCKSVREKIIGYTDNGFLHMAHNCPIYETLFNDLNNGRLIKE